MGAWSSKSGSAAAACIAAVSLALAAQAAEPATAAVAPAPPASPAPAAAEAADAGAALAPAPVVARKPLSPDDPDVPRTELPDALKDEADASLGWALFRTVVVLGLVLMLVWLTLNQGLRRLLGIRSPVGGASVVSVLERIPLDQKRTLFVVKAAGEYLLLGAGDGSVGLVSKLDAQEVEKLSQRPQGGATLSPLLARLLSRKNP